MTDPEQPVPPSPPVVRYGGTAVYVEDVSAALAFYERSFGFKTRFFDPSLEYGELETQGGSVVAFASHKTGAFLMSDRYVRPEAGRPAGVELAFFAGDVSAAFARAVAAGATPLSEPKVMPWGATVAYLRDPEGVIIGLSTPIGG